MKEKDIVDFFDNRAASWDDELVVDSQVINRILDEGGVKQGSRVLDVASGTGILFEYYKERGVSSILGIDISPEMVKRAREKYPDINVICADAGKHGFSEDFDTVMIHNAFPHFSEPDKVISNLLTALKKGGRLTVAHSASRAEIEKCHSTAAKKVSHSLPQADELASFLGAYLVVDVVISDDSMYMVSGLIK